MPEFLEYALSSYVKDIIRVLDTQRMSHFICSRYGSIIDAKRRLGTTAELRSASLATQRALFANSTAF